jgi:hypothetical protein
VRIDGVVISCYRLDMEMTRICVASIRYWYPNIAIWLLKDKSYRDFDTREIQQYWDVREYPIETKNLGWGFGKLEVITGLPSRRVLLLDSDTALSGRLLDDLECFREDLIVESKDYVTSNEIETQFFSFESLQRLDPSYIFPGFGFNTGGLIVNTGVISKSDFDALVDWKTRRVVHTDVFRLAEQGVLNYVVHCKMRRGELTVQRQPFMVWPGDLEKMSRIKVEHLTPESPHRYLIHWAGMRWGKLPQEMPRPDILLHFEKLYYQRIPLGNILRHWRRAAFRFRRGIVTPVKTLIRKFALKGKFVASDPKRKS